VGVNVSGSSQTDGAGGGSGIGTGYAHETGADSRIEHLVIANGNVSGNSKTGAAGGGSGIGTGCAWNNGANSSIKTLTIVDANVSGSSTAGGEGGGSGIGIGRSFEAGSDSNVGCLRLSGNLILLCDSFRASRILISNASVLVFTQGDRVFEASPDLFGMDFLMILYGTASFELNEPSVVGRPSLCIGDMTLPVRECTWRFCVSGVVCSATVVGAIRGLFALLPGGGAYSVQADGAVSGFLGPSEDETTFHVFPEGTFFPHGYFHLTGTNNFVKTRSLSFTESGNQILERRSVLVATAWFLFFGFDVN
jgi:hypothetical protein